MRHAHFSLPNQSILRSVAVSAFSSSSSPNFSKCFCLRKTALVYANYLRSIFSVSQLKALGTRSRGYLSKLRRVLCWEESYSSLCSSLTSTEFLAALANFFPPNLAQAELPTPSRSIFLAQAWISSFASLIFSWSLYFFPSAWKSSSVIFIHKIGKASRLTGFLAAYLSHLLCR